MSNFMFAIDGYLSNYQRVSACDELIKQLKKFFPDTKILLLNKYKESFGLDKSVDYYFYYSDGFMVGEPPKEIIEDGRYSRPYVFFRTSAGTLENWMPDVGVTDHVANVFNGFLISSKIANLFGHNRVFRIEYDMLYHEDEILDLKEKLNKFENEDFIFFGNRKEGYWSSQHLSLMDIHFCGFSTKFFENVDIIMNSEEYWNFCNKLKYWGKSCEYFLSMFFQSNINQYSGSEYDGLVRDRFPKSSFDRINSSGLWEDRWKDVPAICRVSYDNGLTEKDDELILFYRNNDLDSLSFKVETNFGYQKEGTLEKNHWFYEKISLTDDFEFTCLSIQNNKKHIFSKKVSKKDILKLNHRFLLK